MGKLPDFIQWQTETTSPSVIGGQVIRLESQSLSIQSPFGGAVWNRPTAVLVGQHGLTKRIPITDVTRSALWFLAAIGMVTSGLIWISAKFRRN